MKKQKSMMDHMRSRNSMVGGEDPIRSKGLDPVKKIDVSKNDITIPGPSKEYQKFRGEQDKKIKRKAALRNVRDWAIMTAGTGVGAIGGFYGLTTEKKQRDGTMKRVWRWSK